jgi:hypothetical protein
MIMSKLITIILAALLTMGLAYYRPVEFREIEKIVEVREKERSFSEYLEESAKAYGVPLTVAHAMVHQESGGKMASIRHEPGQMERAKKVTRFSGENLRQASSSHCALQIMGYNAHTLGLSWADLYNPQTCAEVGMAIMGKCIERHKAKSPLAKMTGALTCYNGSEAYAHAILNRLGRALLEEHLARS